MIKTAILGASILLTAAALPALAQGNMSFFITSKGPGNGADLGGLKGADAHCESLAKAAGSSGKRSVRPVSAIWASRKAATARASARSDGVRGSVTSSARTGSICADDGRGE